MVFVIVVWVKIEEVFYQKNTLGRACFFFVLYPFNFYVSAQYVGVRIGRFS